MGALSDAHLLYRQAQALDARRMAADLGADPTEAGAGDDPSGADAHTLRGEVDRLLQRAHDAGELGIAPNELLRIWVSVDLPPTEG